MKRIVILLIGSFIILSAKENKYLDYTNALMHYHFELKNFNKIKVPFERNENMIGTQKIKTHSLLKKKIKITLLAVLNNSAHIMIQEYLGGSLIKSYKKWIKVGSVVEKYYKVKKIALNEVIFQYKNKIIIKKLYKKIPGIKEK